MGLLDSIIQSSQATKRNIRSLLDDPYGFTNSLLNRGVENTQAHLNKLTGRPYNPAYDDAYKRSMEEVAFQGMFAGPKAANADIHALWKAQGMADKAIPRETIWKQTGWFKAPDGNWKWEFPDNTAQMESGGRFFGPKGGGGRAKDVIDHKQLFNEYPDLGKVNTTYNFEVSKPSGTYSQSGDYITVNNPFGYQASKSTTLHELQHAIQQREGFARGGDVENIPLVLRSLAEDYKRQASSLYDTAMSGDRLNPGEILKPGALAKSRRLHNMAQEYELMANHAESMPSSAYEAYKRLAGETEARLTQARMNLTDAERRAIPPWSEGPYGYDVPESQQIVRFGNGPSMSQSDSWVRPKLSDFDGDKLKLEEAQSAINERMMKDLIAKLKEYGINPEAPGLSAGLGSEYTPWTNAIGGRSIYTNVPGYGIVRFSDHPARATNTFSNPGEALNAIRETYSARQRSAQEAIKIREMLGLKDEPGKANLQKINDFIANNPQTGQAKDPGYWKQKAALSPIKGDFSFINLDVRNPFDGVTPNASNLVQDARGTIVNGNVLTGLLPYALLGGLLGTEYTEGK